MYHTSWTPRTLGSGRSPFWWGLISLLRRAGEWRAQWVRPAPMRHRRAGHRVTVNRVWTTIGTSPGRRPQTNLERCVNVVLLLTVPAGLIVANVRRERSIR